jgi:pilus assembly protein CpaB
LAIDDIISTNPKSRREGPSSRRSASRAIAAGAVALIAGVLAVAMLKNYADRHQLNQNMTPVVVAAMDVPMATVLRAEHLAVVSWPRGSQPEGTFRDAKELVGRVLTAKVFRSEAIITAKVASREAGSGLAALIPENMRAAAVRVDDVVGVAGFIHPEDRVDVIVTLRPERGGETTSKVILQNVRVLAVGKEVEEEEEKNRNKPLPVTVATLLVTTEQSEKLALAASQGKLLLTLRSGTDQNEIPTSGMVPGVLLAGAPAHAPEPPKPTAEAPPPVRVWHRVERPTPTAAVPPPAPAERREVVEILRGDRFEQRKFDGKEQP